MHIHILGICGTFMGGLAVLASQLNDKVTGSDQNVYPPMSTQLNELGIKIFQGYDDVSQLIPKPDWIIVGNVMRRGMPVIEALLNQDLNRLSGPEWLERFVLPGRHVLAVSGTHGKTTTSSMLAWILEYAGLEPGFLIGGIPQDFGVSARLGQGPFFVVEADEYDSAFFDKRSKFIHYHPRTLIINNIEFDHADIFSDLAAIQLQFHQLVRTVPGEGLIVYPQIDENVIEVLKKGCWTKKVTFNSQQEAGWYIRNFIPTKNQFEVWFENQNYGELTLPLLGQHNIQNALAAIAAAQHVGVEASMAIKALAIFKGVKRRMDLKGSKNGITVYDDFAHHPTAIQVTLAGLRAKIGTTTRIIAVLDIRSNTMKAGYHQEELALSVQEADVAYFYQSPDVTWDVHKVFAKTGKPGGVYQELNVLLKTLLERVTAGDQVLFMSNGGFGGIPTLFLDQL